MRLLRWLLFRLRALTTHAARERELDAELQFHLEADVEERIEAGLTADDALREARRRLGPTAHIREDTRGVWSWLAAERLWHDARYAVRVLCRQPAFTVAALLTIVLIVGGITTMFIGIDSRTWFFSTLICTAVGLSIGIFPALRTVGAGFAERLNEDARVSLVSRRRSRLQRG
jgi:hypothetical protein